MKRLILCLVLVFGLVQAGHLFAQEEQVLSGTIPPGFSIQGVSYLDQVLAMQVYITAGSDNLPVPGLLQYVAGQSYYMNVFVFNASTSAKSYKVEFNLSYNDGANYYPTKRGSFSIPAADSGVCRTNITAYVAKRGLLTLTGRVYGAGMGNDNKVTSQVYVY